jgi:hypothetical protein
MRPFRLGFLLFVVASFSASLPAQQLTPSAAGTPSLPQPNAQGPALIQRGLAALTGGVQVRDVALTGTATGVQSGDIVLVATASGKAQITLTSSAGVNTQTDDYSAAGPHAGNYSGPDGVTHKIPSQSLLGIHPAWFFPAFILAAGSSSTDNAASDLGHEARNGAEIHRLAVWRRPTGLAPLFQASLQRSSQQNLFLDPTSLLPVAMTFHIRPFNPNKPSFRTVPSAPVEEEEEIRYSDYRQVQGVPIAFHMQIYMHGSLIGDIQISSATINTGANIAAVN